MSIDRELRGEAGRIKGTLERLRKEIERDKINRIRCRAILVDMKSAFEKIKYFFVRLWDSYAQQLPAQDLLSMIIKVWGSQAGKENIERGFDSRISNISSAIYSIDTPQYYDDTTIRRNLSDLVITTDTFLTVLNQEIFSRLSQSLSTFSQLGELVGTRPMGLDDNWLVANSYLSAMEIVVNKKRKELGLEKEEKKDFGERLRELFITLEEKGERISELGKQLPQAFWKIRNQVVHKGYSPDQEELELVVSWVKRIISLVS